MPAFANALRPFLPVVTDVLIPPAGAAGRTARASSRPGEIHGKRYSHASRIDRIRTCDPMLPKHVRYQTAPQSDIFVQDSVAYQLRTCPIKRDFLRFWHRLKQYHDAFILILSRV